MSDQPDKRKKAHGEEIDISNGALFLRILALERKLQDMEMDLRNAKRDIPFRVGGSR